MGRCAPILEYRSVKWGNPAYRNVRKLYLEAFPKQERFSLIWLLLMSLQRHVHFRALYEADRFCGLTYFVHVQSTVYLVYLAVDPVLRGQGYGTRILRMLQDSYADSEVVLDIEPVINSAPDYPERVRRLHFYERSGFRKTNLQLRDSDGAFTILTTARQLNRPGLLRALKQIYRGLDKFKIEQI